MQSIHDLGDVRHKLNSVRAGFVAQGTSLHAWCRENGIDTPTARRAINGQSKGPKAAALAERLLLAAGVIE